LDVTLQRYRRLNLICQVYLLGSLGLVTTWNLATLFSGFGFNGWWLILIPLPGWLGWLGLQLTRMFLVYSTSNYPHTYRLLYSAPPGWIDDRSRQTLLNLIRSGTGLDIFWARDGEEVGCWLSVANHGPILEQLVRDVFPNGSLEVAAPPEVGQGAVILHWQKGPADLPPPSKLCRQAGLEGVYFHWRSETTATVAIWGPAARELAGQLAQANEHIFGQGQKLLAPPFVGDNPWPGLPPFPASEGYAGLSALSALERLAPALRTAGRSALVIGQDVEGQLVGFGLPDLTGMQLLRIAGQATEPVVIDLVQKAVQAERPVCLLDGRGVVTTRLARRLLRAVAVENVLMSDVDRPGQSRFRLNPLWLPDDLPGKAMILSNGWLAWLRELGVTPGGLGETAYWHTQQAVILTALVTARQGIELDVPGLNQALQAPDFLALVGDDIWSEVKILPADLWAWWRAEGRATTRFDSHLRLAHLRDRLGALLALPEYSVLWRAPYLDPLAALTGGQSLIWRLPDPRRRLPAYITSQLLALSSLLTVWPEDQPPLLIFLHELNAGAWVERLRAFPGARVIVSTEHIKPWSTSLTPSALLLSRLEREEAEQLRATLPEVRATDLRRLPPNRLIFKQGSELCTVDIRE
jgi:hypothetical protein